MKTFIYLPNGDFIRLDTITAVTRSDASPGDGSLGALPWSLSVFHSGGGCSRLEAQDQEQRDRVAKRLIKCIQDEIIRQTSPR